MRQPEPNSLFVGDCAEVVSGWPDGCLDLVIGSPPYPEKGERYDGAAQRWDARDWAKWMVRVTLAMLSKCRGPVLWVVNNSTTPGHYLPGVERLLVSLDDFGVDLERPCIWHKNAPPNRKNWFGNDWEFVVAAKHPGPVPYWNWEAIGTPPKFKAGGRFRQRDKHGRRKLGNEYPQNKITRPRDVIRATVGGGHLGSKLAHRSEAPFPESLVEPFILALCPPDGLVLDPFVGSGTVPAVARRHGRNYVGIDIRQSQIDLTRERLAIER
ncbi:MAG: site-specific DNA-methyltransferase [bacterium]|nr:site-specific DNA-methyltransferase [bacterium]